MMLVNIWNKIFSLLTTSQSISTKQTERMTVNLSQTEPPAKLISDVEPQSYLLEQILSKFSDCIFLFDHHGTCLHANAAGSPTLNLAEMIGKNWHEFDFPPKMAESFAQSFAGGSRDKRVLTGETCVSFVFSNRCFEYTLYPIHSLDGNLRFVVTTIKDITARKWNDEELKVYREQLEELVKGRTYDLIRTNNKLQQEIIQRRQAEEEARRSEARLRRITNAMQDMICQVDRAGIIEYASPSYQRAVGYAPDYMIGQPFLEFVHPEDQEKVKKTMQAALETRLAGSIEFRHLHASQEYLWVETLGNYLYDEQGKIGGIIFCTRDITERKRLENEMAKLDRMNLVGEMAASIAHEIRNPMTTIRGFLQVLKVKDGCRQYRESFELMIEELDRANAIISEYLSLAKGKVVNLEKRDLNAIIHALAPLLRSDAITADKYVHINLGQIPELLLDEKEIRQLIINLVRNGLEAMTAGGSLTIQTFMDGNEAVLAIKDEGTGIAPTVLEKLGTPFFTTKENGNGLGLPVCYSIAARHNATIKVETGTSGTTFFVRFAVNPSRMN